MITNAATSITKSFFYSPINFSNVSMGYSKQGAEQDQNLVLPGSSSTLEVDESGCVSIFGRAHCEALSVDGLVLWHGFRQDLGFHLTKCCAALASDLEASLQS